MIIVDLYIRVSTDDQNDGYSPRYQEESLRRFCELKGYHINRVYNEDHSAKSFERPIFKQMLMGYRKKKGVVNVLLFTKWDRFSRNAADAYGMITTLNKLGIDLLAIEQPIDLSIPENKIMLAFYLASPEVENHRRALNVSGGMRRAMKEGRYMGKAPIGYRNRQADKKKWIEPDPATRTIVVEAFEEVATGKYSVESIMKFARNKGINCSKNNFWTMLRNPVYCGHIFLPAYKTEPAELITGQHEPLISKDLFYQVQDTLDGKKKVQRVKKKEDDRFPLRGFLECHVDGRSLTASASTGRKKKKYEYYHCTSACGTRFQAPAVNDAIIAEFRKWKPDPAVKVLYRYILTDVLSQQKEEQKIQLAEIRKAMAMLTDRHVKARELLLIDALEPDDYKTIKRECEERMARLEAQVAEITMQQPLDIAPQLEQGIAVLETLDQRYEKLDGSIKRQIIDSIFPGKLVFDGKGFRTARINEAVQLIYNLGAAFRQIKTGQEGEISDVSREVIPLGLEPRAPTLKVLCSTN
jgi:site-specific DNA recombinase